MTAKSPFSITGRICLAVTGLALLSACMGGGAAQSTMPPAGGAAGVTGSNAGVYYSWIQPEIQAAWDQGYLGQGAQITIIDDFTSGDKTFGRLTDERQRLRHGEWVDLQTALMAPDATRVTQDFTATQSVQLGAGMLNVLNLSYGMFAPSGLSDAQIDWTARESSVIDHAENGAAVVVKSAGNHAIAMGGVNSSGEVDYLDRALIGADTAIFVGALVGHGTEANPVSLASFSNFAGSDPVVQNQYLAVGLRSDLTSLNGTSFAAPIVSGYAAVLGSKFTTATPRQITSQLLQSARTDTILNYDPALHGRGEASIARALAPASIR
ncbi:S8 family serine peptidase [Yoonia vestfoldensis]|uniref:Subtilase family protein n=1 Tax=Yoonia vestfoldensis TaxID=245188 RepID=A0A1Y0ECN2_9RHOB|nr:S8 family serine peptidase [Yoonia vestfoldensis]ARU01151.1 subtilase family protein [Yoonia vestfoldensis]